MARTESRAVPLGSPAPAFSLLDVTSGAQVASADLGAGQPLLVMFICNHCPFVKHIRAQLAAIGRDYQEKLGIVAISSNDVATHPADHPDRMREEAAAQGYSFPYLYDETQEVAIAYGAACTPDFFLFDRDRALAYHGQLDGSRPGNDVPVTGADLRAAIDALLAGGAPASAQTPSVGCNIKWKAGNRPS